jgi:hypothetical protein
MTNKSKKELQDNLNELQGLLYFEENYRDGFCGTSLLRIKYEISEIEKRLEEMEKDNDNNI